MSYHEDYLYHHGIKGMKWGVRRYQNKDGSLTAKGKKRYSSVAELEADIQAKHLKRKERAEKMSDASRKIGRGAKAAAKVMAKMAKTSLKVAMPMAKKGAKVAGKLLKKGFTLSKNLISKKRKSDWSDDAKTAKNISKKSVKEMSNAELRKLNERTQLETQYRSLNPGFVKKGMRFVTTAAAVTGTILTLSNNSGKVINLGKGAANKIIDAAGNMVMRDLAKRL